MNKGHKGQVLFPTLLAIPMLLLFVFLLFETTKLSREKIRQQFAVDSAAFIQMGDYTNLFNRTAYVNGVFPYRIFKEAYPCPGPSVIKSDNNKVVCLYEALYNAGIFPRRFGDTNSKYNLQGERDLDNQAQWEIKFFEDSPGDSEIDQDVKDLAVGKWSQSNPVYDPRRGQGMNKEKNLKHESLDGGDLRYSKPIVLMTGTFDKGGPPEYQGRMLYFRSNRDAFITAAFYITVYNLLGQIANSQIDVFNKLVDGFKFFRKSYYLNAGCPELSTCGNDGVKLFKKPKINKYYAKKLLMFFSVAPSMDQTSDCPCKITIFGSMCPPCWRSYDESHFKTFDTVTGLFQLATIDNSNNFFENIGQGFPVYQGWGKGVINNNFFNVDFRDKSSIISEGCENTEPGLPCVHVKVASQGPCFSKSGNSCKDVSDNNSVWPNPTPKYQTRLYP